MSKEIELLDGKLDLIVDSIKDMREEFRSFREAHNDTHNTISIDIAGVKSKISWIIGIGTVVAFIGAPIIAAIIDRLIG